MMFNATFNNIQLYGGGQFYWWRKQEFPEVTDNNTSSWFSVLETKGDFQSV